MNVQPSASSHDSNILLAQPSELPQDAILTFSLRTQSPAAFAHDETIEVTTSDESSSATLSFANGGMMLENSQVAVATLNPAKVFGGAAFGPLQFRINLQGCRRRLAASCQSRAPAHAEGIEMPRHAGTRLQAVGFQSFLDRLGIERCGVHPSREGAGWLF